MENNQVSSDEKTSSSDSDSEIDELDDSVQGASREKRSIDPCRCEGAVRVNDKTVRVVWPPQTPSTSANTPWKHLKPVKFTNPWFGTRMQLYCRTGNLLAVYPNGRIRGVEEENNIYSLLELVSALQAGHVRIKGIVTELYVAMDHKGRLYGEPDANEEGTVFMESFQGSYTTYLSRKYAHLGWYIGLKRSGKVKRGPKTGYGQKAISFLPRRSKFQ